MPRAHPATVPGPFAFRWILFGWTALAVYYTLQDFVWVALGAGALPSDATLLRRLIAHGTGVVFTPLVLWIAVRNPVRGLRAGPIAFHFVCSVVAAVAWCFATYSLNWLVQEQMPRLSFWIVLSYPEVVQYHVILVALGSIAAAMERARSRELRERELETALARAQFQALQAQVHPHFLFNTLHSIGEMVHHDPARADRMITRLGELLRSTLDASGAQLIPLGSELRILSSYLAIQQARFGARLVVRIEVAAGLHHALVPALVLQPVVENSIRHGLEPRREPTTVVVRATREGSRLVLEVDDDGAGFQERPARRRAGIGLSNLRARLATLFGDAFEFAAGPGDAAGARVRIRIPLQWEADPAVGVRAGG